MSDKASCNTTVTILPDNIKTKIKGIMNFDISTALAAGSGDGWFYAEPTLTDSSAVVLGTTEDYLGPTTGAATITTSDKIRWIAIKHTGTTNGSTKTGLGAVLTINAGTAAYNLAEGIFLAPGEMIVLKFASARTVAGLTGVAVVTSAGIPFAASVSGDKVRLVVTGILTNVAS